MELNRSQPMTETVSLRLTTAERVVLEQLAAREDRTISRYVRRHLRIHREEEQGAGQ